MIHRTFSLLSRNNVTSCVITQDAPHITTEATVPPRSGISALCIPHLPFLALSLPLSLRSSKVRQISSDLQLSVSTRQRRYQPLPMPSSLTRGLQRVISLSSRVPPYMGTYSSQPPWTPLSPRPLPLRCPHTHHLLHIVPPAGDGPIYSLSHSPVSPASQHPLLATFFESAQRHSMS